MRDPSGKDATPRDKGATPVAHTCLARGKHAPLWSPKRDSDLDKCPLDGVRRPTGIFNAHQTLNAPLAPRSPLSGAITRLTKGHLRRDRTPPSRHSRRNAAQTHPLNANRFKLDSPLQRALARASSGCQHISDQKHSAIKILGSRLTWSRHFPSSGVNRN